MPRTGWTSICFCCWCVIETESEKIYVCSGQNMEIINLTLRLLMSYIYIYIYMELLFLMFLDHTQPRTTIGRTSLDEWSARRRDLYLTTHDTHNRQISMPPVGFEPTISAGERPQAAHLPTVLPTACPTCLLSYRLWCIVVCDLETSRTGESCIYDLSSLSVKDLTLILLTWRKWTPNNASK